MVSREKGWARWIAHTTNKRPYWTLAIILVVTVIASGLSETLEMRLNFTDLLPESNKIAQRYRAVMNDWVEPSIVVVLEGDRDLTSEMAVELDTLLPQLDEIYNVEGKMPRDFFIDHGFSLTEPKDFDRYTRVFNDPGLLSLLTAFNDDYEREYSDSEDNLRNDEIEVAQSLQGLWHSLEVLDANLAANPDAADISESAEAFAMGDEWMLSLDRKMLMILVYPDVNTMRDTDKLLAVTQNVRDLVTEVSAHHPGVKAELSGMGPIGQAEMNSVGTYTMVLMLIALVIIYLLLARSARGWILPLVQLIPLVLGIIWTMGLLALIFGSLNYFTVMMGIVLAGVGIDFTIHLIARYGQERGTGVPLEDALTAMLGGTGTGVLTGALTTSAAFFTLMIADTKGIFEFGFAAGSGVLLTLVSVFFTLPTLLVIRERIIEKRGKTVRFASGQREGWEALGQVSVAVWKRPAIILPLFVLLIAAALWAASEIDFEYDFMKLEPQKARAVQLQRVLPERFGIADQGGWVINTDIEQARKEREQLKDLSVVGAVQSISDFIPSEENLESYRPKLLAMRRNLMANPPTSSPNVSNQQLADQINRLWDNLDLISNLAYQAGLDRLVTVIDGMTGYDAQSDKYIQTAVLPHLVARLEVGVPQKRLTQVAAGFEKKMHELMLRMTGDDEVEVSDLPASVRLSILPRDGSMRYRTTVSPRGYVWDRDASNRFIDQTSAVAPGIVSSPQLFIVMTEETLRDGRNGALLALAVIVILLLIHFRSFAGLIAIFPLVGSAALMIGAMYLIGMDYNYINLIALPIILGIGIDDGVHALHRYREESARGGQRIHDTFRHVGRAILLTSLTTMIGFGVIGFYEMPGMASFGIVLFMGVGFCFISTVLVLPAVMKVLLREKPRGEEN